jgi:hypothetical protein
VRPLRTIAALIGLLVPVAPATAATRSVHVLGLPTATVVLPPGPHLVGVRWHGPRNAALAVRTAAGTWTILEAVASRNGAWVSEPVWIGRAQAVAVRLAPTVRGAALEVIAPGTDRTGPTRTATAPRSGTSLLPEPLIHPRAAWGANESLRRHGPVTFDRLGVVFVHHTDSANGYGPADVPSIIRGIYAYHVLSLGWWDIGYSYLVDAFGGIWEGRYGGVAVNVRGAHTQGFNEGSSGIALIGTYQDAAPTAAEVDALERLIAWRLDVAHVDPLARAHLLSAGTAKHRAGAVVAFDAISGHRDAVYTDCPGNVVYAMLPAVRRAVAGLLALRITDATATPVALDPSTGTLPVRFHALLSRAAPWHVSVVDAGGAELRGFDGTGRAVDAAWDGSGDDPTMPRPPLESLRWRITAGTPYGQARPAVGSFDDLATPDLLPVVRYASVAPRGDGGVERLSLRRGARVAIAVSDATGASVRVIDPGSTRRPGPATITWDGADHTGAAVASGRYAIVVRIAVGSRIATITRTVDVRRALAALTVAPAVLAAGPVVTATATLVRREPTAAVVRLRLPGGGVRVLRRLPAGLTGTTAVTIDRAGLADGAYRVEAVADTAGGRQVLTASLVVDTAAPVIARPVVRRHGPWTIIRASLSERAVLVVDAAGTVRWRAARGAGRILIRLPTARLAGSVSLTLRATDDAGNRSLPRAIGLRG